MIEHALGFVREALADLDGGVKLSTVLRKGVRVARLRNDWSNLVWLLHESVDVADDAARAGILAEIQPHLDTLDFEPLRRAQVDAYMEERRIKVIDEHGNVEAREKLCGLSVAAIEENIGYLEQTGRSAVAPAGMHPVDLYFAEEAHRQTRASTAFMVAQHRALLTRIERRVFDFLSVTERELAYGQASADIFQRNRQYVDARLAEIAPEALQQFASAFRRLAEGDVEARSQALVSCRRVLKSLADRLYPASGKPVTGSDGKERVLTDELFVSRLWQYVAERVKGHASGDLLLAQVQDIGNRIDHLNRLTSKGVHAVVPEFEVNQAVIQTYTVAGDLLRLAGGTSAAISDAPAGSGTTTRPAACV